MSTLKFITVKGLKFGINFTPERILEGIEYRPKSNDVFIASYPKCGTTWLQQIIYLIMHNGQPAPTGDHFFRSTPFLEKLGQPGLDVMLHPGAIKTHLPFNLINFSSQAKYIYITRNPKDCCVSYYNHCQSYAPYQFCNGTFDYFFNLFVNGQSHYGDYFDHMISWYDNRHLPNVLFLTYEDLKMDRKSAIFKIAEFLGKDLDENSDEMDQILYYSGLDYMKSCVNRFYTDFTGNHLELVRKGKMGSWRDVLTNEQNRRIDKKIEAKLGGTFILNSWKMVNCL